MRPLAAALLLAAALALPSAAAAQSCGASASAVAFGSYNPLSPLPDDANGMVTVSCGPSLVPLVVNYSVSLSVGSSGSYAMRRMVSGGRTLNYQLYNNALRTVAWGDGSGSSGTVHGAFLLTLLGGAIANHPVYGRMPALQSAAAPGSYADTITVTVSY